MPSPAPEKLRLLVVLNVFPPDVLGGAALFSDLLYSLADRGMDVTVRCAYPYYPEWEDKSGQNGWHISRYDDRGVHVERYGLFIPGNPHSLLQRFLYEGSFLVSVLRSVGSRKRFDAVMVYCPLVGAVAYAAIHRWIFRTPLWLNVQDLSAHAAAASGISRFRFVNRMLEGAQNFFFNAGDVWSSISPVMIRMLRRIRRRNQPILFMPNWLHKSLADEIDRLPSKIGRTPDKPVKLMYAGNIGDKQDLLPFCKFLHQSDAAFEFRIHGNGSMASEVQEWVRSSGDERFWLGPFLSDADYVRAIHASDLFVITEVANSVGAFIPSKIIPGMGTSTPILAVCDHDSPLGEEVLNAGPGYHFSWDDVDQVPDFLDALPDRPGDFADRQANAARRAKTFDRNEVIGRFEKLIRKLATGEPIEDESAT